MLLTASFTADIQVRDTLLQTTNANTLNGLITAAVGSSTGSLTLATQPLAVLDLPLGGAFAATPPQTGPATLQITIDGLSVTPGLQPPGSLAPFDTFLMHTAFLGTNSAQNIIGVQVSPPQFNPSGIAECTAVGGSAFDSFGTVTHLCMARGGSSGPLSVSITGGGVQGTSQLFRVVEDPCPEDCAARSTACASYQCDALTTRCVVARLTTGDCRCGQLQQLPLSVTMLYVGCAAG
jgi:hypothetical protein